MRTLPKNATAAAELLGSLDFGAACSMIASRCDDPWLCGTIARGVVPADRGVYWCPTADDASVWPARVLIYTAGAEVNAALLTISLDDSRVFLVCVVPGHLVTDWQAGEQGRERLRSGIDAPDHAHPV